MLIEEKGTVEALAHISGATSVDQHLMINSEAGFVTTILWCSTEMSNTNYSWKKLKEQLGEDIDSKVQGMVFLKGKQDVCFDIPTASPAEVQKKWHDSRRGPPSVATQQPDPEGPREGYCNFRDSGEAAEVSGDSGKEVGASEDSDQDVQRKQQIPKQRPEAEF